MAKERLFPIEDLFSVRFDTAVITEEYHLAKVSEKIECLGRWDACISTVFIDFKTNKYYEVTYIQGATEYQEDEGFYPVEDGMAKCYEVKPVEVTTIQYKYVE